MPWFKKKTQSKAKKTDGGDGRAASPKRSQSQSLRDSSEKWRASTGMDSADEDLEPDEHEEDEEEGYASVPRGLSKIPSTLSPVSGTRGGSVKDTEDAALLQSPASGWSLSNMFKRADTMGDSGSPENLSPVSPTPVSRSRSKLDHASSPSQCGPQSKGSSGAAKAAPSWTDRFKNLTIDTNLLNRNSDVAAHASMGDLTSANLLLVCSFLKDRDVCALRTCSTQFKHLTVPTRKRSPVSKSPTKKNSKHKSSSKAAPKRKGSLTTTGSGTSPMQGGRRKSLKPDEHTHKRPIRRKGSLKTPDSTPLQPLRKKSQADLANLPSTPQTQARGCCGTAGQLDSCVVM
eukprot:GILJ01005665.1.p1 GENE.GILJ01005665.1~~GILJ01005665.1.p1  ORF type:complete len:345 (+),score=44.01 GILJ01005665.1:45-1079(+)